MGFLSHMKHIKLFEFYKRTIGFKYSEPKVKIGILCCVLGSPKKALVKEVLDDIDAKYEESSIKIKSPENVDLPQNVDCDKVIMFDLLVYTEREVEGIIEDFSKAMFKKKVSIIDALTKEY